MRAWVSGRIHRDASNPDEGAIHRPQGGQGTPELAVIGADSDGTRRRRIARRTPARETLDDDHTPATRGAGRLGRVWGGNIDPRARGEGQHRTGKHEALPAYVLEAGLIRRGPEEAAEGANRRIIMSPIRR